MDGSTFLLYLSVPEPRQKTSNPMRKQLSLLVLLVLAAAGSAHAYDFSAVTSSGHTLYYNIVSGGAEVTYPSYSPYTVDSYWSYTTKPTGALVIDSTVNRGGTTYSVTSIGSHAFEGCTGITSVTIPNSVTSIAYHAFYGCTGLTSVTIPNSVTSIGEGTFSGCTGLTSVTIPNSVTSIAYHAFSGCTGLTSVTIPNSVTSIGNQAFSGCTGLISLVFNATNCTSAGSSDYPVFYGCPITSVTFGSNVHNIPDYLLYNCTGLTSVTIPNSVTSIGNQAFYYCTGLSSVSIPYSVVNIGSNAFYLVNTLIYNGSASGSPWGAFHHYYSDVNFLYADSAHTTLVCYIGTSSAVVIPNTVTNIGTGAFSNCTGLTSVTIPNSVTTIVTINTPFYF